MRADNIPSGDLDIQLIVRDDAGDSPLSIFADVTAVH